MWYSAIPLTEREGEGNETFVLGCTGNTRARWLHNGHEAY